MTAKPSWLDRKTKLLIGLQFIADGLFHPVYKSVEKVVGKKRTDELLDWALSEKESQEQVEANPQPPISDDQIDTPPQSVDAIDITGATLFGPHKNKNPAKARITDTLISVRIRGDGIVMKYKTSGWPNNDSGIGENIDGRVYVYWQQGGKLVGGHFDWKRPNTKDREFKNIRNGYLDGNQPPKGATLWFVLMTNKADRRTNVVKADGVFP